MNISEKKIDALNSELTLVIAAEDYAAPLEGKLKGLKKKAEFKGFRKGMAPMSLIKKVYGGQAMAEVINGIIGEQLDAFIRDNKLNILGEPIQSANQPELDWEEGKDFTFVFDLGLSPEVNVEVSADDSIPVYKITPDAKMKENLMKSYKEFYAKQAEEGKGEARSDEDIEKEIDARLSQDAESQSAWRLTHDLKDYFVKKAGVELPEAFLKRWLLQSGGDKYTEEEVEKQFPSFIEDFKWQLVRGSLMRKFDFKIEEADLRTEAENYVRYQYAMYGMADVPADLLKDAVNNMMQDRNQLSRIIEQAEDSKVLDKIKQTVTLKNKKISSEKFRELK
ncbi:MAG: hypothetical protein J5764_02515 [Bacteroidales bacterium]|nr:hypothetical protein [Bacteroidales bacterium]MBO4446981.1 hypothetical protein [Bacteroidales bacterium]